MTSQSTGRHSRLVKGALRGALFTALFLALVIPLGTPAIAASPQPAWDTDRTLPCGGKGVEEFNPAFGLPIVRWDDGVIHKALTIVVFSDAQRLEEDGHSHRFHYSTTANGPLTYQVNAHDVSVFGPICVVPPGIAGPGPAPWQFNLVVPCGQDPSLNYDPRFGFTITWVGPAQDKLIFDAWKDAGHVAAPGRDTRTTVTTDHAFAGCKLFWTDHPAEHRVSFLARLQDTKQPAAQSN